MLPRIAILEETSMKAMHCFIFTVAVLAAFVTPRVSVAQAHPEFIALGRLSAVLYKPDNGPAPHVAFVIAHRTANYLNHIACRDFFRRGFLAVCYTNGFENNQATVRSA